MRHLLVPFAALLMMAPALPAAGGESAPSPVPGKPALAAAPRPVATAADAAVEARRLFDAGSHDGARTLYEAALALERAERRLAEVARPAPTPPRDERPLHRRVWLWVAVGGALVGGLVAGAALWEAFDRDDPCSRSPCAYTYALSR